MGYEVYYQITMLISKELDLTYFYKMTRTGSRQLKLNGQGDKS